MRLRETDIAILRFLEAGEKATLEVSWLAKKKWHTIYQRLKKLLEEGYVESNYIKEKNKDNKKETETRLWSITKKGIEIIKEYPKQ